MSDPPMTEASDRRARPRPERAAVLGLSDLEAIRLVLRGGSVVDWYRLNFNGPEEARKLLRVLEIRMEDARDQAHVEALRTKAAAYLMAEHNYRIPEELLRCPPFDLFLYASQLKGRRRDRFFACLLLKVMHITHHIQARELRYRLPLSNSELSQLLIEKVDVFAAALRREGFPLVDYAGGEKQLSSMITKLLVKKQHHAAAIRDRVRFRFTTEREGDLVPLLHHMTDRLFPYNYVVPGQTVNQLINFTALIESHASYRERASEFQVEFGHEERSPPGLNEFSGPTYRVINFVADIPIRLPDSVLVQDSEFRDFGPVIFGLAEFQIADDVTAGENESGDNRHDRYKERQKRVVRERLERGLRGGVLEDEDGERPSS